MHVVVIGGWAPSLVLFRWPLLSALRARGHRVTALAADTTDAVRERLATLGIDLVDVPFERAGLDPRADVGVLIELVRQLRRLRPDVVFAYTIKPVIYGHLAAQLVGVRRRFAMITGLGYAFQGTGPTRAAVRALASRLYRVALRGAAGLFLQNPDDETDLRRAGAFPPALRITQVRGSGVDTTAYPARELRSEPPRFLFIGRLLREKGILAYVELARTIRRTHPEVVFEVVGGIDPNPTSATTAMVDAWVRDGTIEYAGEVSDVRPHLDRCHVLVLPSFREGTPRSVLEAMSTARPVIVTDVPGCRETIVDGEHGFIVPLHDASSLEAAARKLIDDRALRVRLGRAARDRVCALYDADRVAAEMLRVMAL